MPPRNTAFNPKWKEIYPWVNSVPKENYKAYCKLCKKIFSVAAKGEGCLKEHANSDKHKELDRSAVRSHSLDRYFSSMYFHSFDSMKLFIIEKLMSFLICTQRKKLQHFLLMFKIKASLFVVETRSMLMILQLFHVCFECAQFF